MNKKLILLSTLLLTSCSSISEVPSNEPYYCAGISKSGWSIAYPQQLFKGKLIKENNQYYFVNTNITEHGFHGLLNDKTKIYTAPETEITLKDLKNKRYDTVYALFDSNSYRITGTHDVNWISVSSCPMPEIVSEIVIGFDYKTSPISHYIDETLE